MRTAAGRRGRGRGAAQRIARPWFDGWPGKRSAQELETCPCIELEVGENHALGRFRTQGCVSVSREVTRVASLRSVIPGFIQGLGTTQAATSPTGIGRLRLESCDHQCDGEREGGARGGGSRRATAPRGQRVAQCQRQPCPRRPCPPCSHPRPWSQQRSCRWSRSLRCRGWPAATQSLAAARRHAGAIVAG